jgi:ABC-type lipoprotein export system ATPase subunit
MIRCHDLHKSYNAEGHGRQVLRGVDLAVSSGELIAVLGRSGSGKTTLLNIIGGLDTGYRGTVEVDGKVLRELSDRELSKYRNTAVGFVFQGFHLLDHLTCADNVALPARFARGRMHLDQRSIQERAVELLTEMGLPEVAGVRPTQLSGGQKQRVGIARALFHQPKLLLCDEVTGNLDTDTGSEILQVLRSLCVERGVTLVTATHDPEITRIADRTVRLQDGVITVGEGMNGAGEA